MGSQTVVCRDLFHQSCHCLCAWHNWHNWHSGETGWKKIDSPEVIQLGYLRNREKILADRRTGRGEIDENKLK
jgi:hypothetical protein